MHLVSSPKTPKTGTKANDCYKVLPLNRIRLYRTTGVRMRTLAAVFAIFLITGTAWAQGTAQINGSVKDQTGAVLPGVEVTATQTATGAKRTAISDETGAFILTTLPIGPYMIEA